MATHSSILAWRIPWMLLLLLLNPTLCDPMDCSLPGSSVHGIFQAIVLEWIAISFSRGIFPIQGSNPGLRRQWHPTLVLLPGEFHGLWSLVGYSPWSCKESDMTERLHFHFLSLLFDYSKNISLF